MNNQNTQQNEMDLLIEFFNSTTTFEKVDSLNVYEQSNLKASISMFGAERIKSAFTKANNSRFLTGNKGYEWKATFGWIINPEHIASILDGKYDDYRRVNKPSNAVPANDPECYESSMPDDDDDEFIKAALAHAFDGMF